MSEILIRKGNDENYSESDLSEDSRIEQRMLLQAATSRKLLF